MIKAKNFCMECGSPLVAVAKFCSSCGCAVGGHKKPVQPVRVSRDEEYEDDDEITVGDLEISASDLSFQVIVPQADSVTIGEAMQQKDIEPFRRPKQRISKKKVLSEIRARASSEAKMFDIE